MAYLVEFDKQGLALQQWRLHLGSSYSVGRSTDCSIVLPHISVSRLHARLQPKRPAAEEVAVDLCELNAVNGTYVNGRRLERREVCRLDSDAEVVFGEARSSAFRVLKEAVRGSGVSVQRPRSVSPPPASSQQRRSVSPPPNGHDEDAAQTTAAKTDRRQRQQPLPAASCADASATTTAGGGGSQRSPRSAAFAALRASRAKRRCRSRSRSRESHSRKRSQSSSASHSSSASASQSPSPSPPRRSEEESRHGGKTRRASKEARSAGTAKSSERRKQEGQPSSRNSKAVDEAPQGQEPTQQQHRHSSAASKSGSQRKSRWARKRSPSPKGNAAVSGGASQEAAADGGAVSSGVAAALQNALQNSKTDGGAELDENLSQILAGIQAARKKRELEKQLQQRMQEEAAAAAAVAAAAAACASGVGSSGLTIQEKRKLLWGKRKADSEGSKAQDGEDKQQSASGGAENAEEKSADPNCYGMSFGSDVTRKSKFLKLMGHKGDISELVQNADAAAAEAHLDPKFTQRLNSELELQYYQGIRRKDGRKTGLGL